MGRKRKRKDKCHSSQGHYMEDDPAVTAEIQTRLKQIFTYCINSDADGEWDFVKNLEIMQCMCTDQKNTKDIVSSVRQIASNVCGTSSAASEFDSYCKKKEFEKQAGMTDEFSVDDSTPYKSVQYGCDISNTSVSNSDASQCLHLKNVEQKMSGSAEESKNENIETLENDSCGNADDIFDWSSCRNHLNKVKFELNTVKSLLSNKDILAWNSHTQKTNIASGVIDHVKKNARPELCTQAWCKFYEILSNFDLVQCDSTGQYRTMHLCEAPGAFITSLNHYLQLRFPELQWTWKATTLNPYYEGHALAAMIQDDRLIGETMDHWDFGLDNTGDILNADNLMKLGNDADQTIKYHLVTADGSIDCQNSPADQESVVSSLHCCEVAAALRILDKGGHFVLKMFTLFENSSVVLMFILNCLFCHVHVFKPATSKPGNSETYVICLNYKGLSEKLVWLPQLLADMGCRGSGDQQLYSDNMLQKIPLEFLRQHSKCCNYFKTLQTKTINRNLELFNRFPPEDNEKLNYLKTRFAETFVTKYEIWPIKAYQKLMPRVDYKTSRVMVVKRWMLNGSFQERQTSEKLPWKSRVEAMKYYEIEQSSTKMKQCENYAAILAELPSWSFIQGRPVSQCKSSLFCDHHLLGELCALVDNKEEEQHPVTPEELTSRGSHSIVQNMSTGTVLNIQHVKCSLWGCLGNHLEDIVTILQDLPRGADFSLSICATLTRFDVGVLFLLHLAFEQIYIINIHVRKSFAPRRVCQCCKFRGDMAVSYLRTLLNHRRQVLEDSNKLQDVLQFVPIKTLCEPSFHSYITKSNEEYIKMVINSKVAVHKDNLNYLLDTETGTSKVENENSD